MARNALTLLVVSIALAIASPASARTSADYAYRFEQVWSAAVRLVRVEMGCPVHDKDEEVGFVLFDYTDGPRAYPASVEMLRTRVDGEVKVRVVLQIPAMPSYIEQMILDRLSRKLVAEFGEPIQPSRPSRETPPEEGNQPGAQQPSGRQPGQQEPSRSREPGGGTSGAPSRQPESGNPGNRNTNRR